MHGCARGPPPEGRWGGRSNPPLFTPIHVRAPVQITHSIIQPTHDSIYAASSPEPTSKICADTCDQMSLMS